MYETTKKKLWSAAIPTVVLPQHAPAPVANGITGTVILEETFTNGTLPDGWTTLDMDEDGYTWQFTFPLSGGEETNSSGREDDHSINSASFYNDNNVLSPNNYLITPQLSLGRNSELTYWVKVIDDDFLDHYGVYISTTGTNPEDFILLFEETLTANEVVWQQRTVEIPQSGDCYIAFRHFNSTNQYIFCIDDIIVSTIPQDSPIENLKLSPHPGASTIIVDGNVTKVEIYDSEGTLIESHTNPVSVIDISRYESGLYTYKLYDSEGNVITRLLNITK